MNEIAIERNGQALKRLLALLFVYLGLADDTQAALGATDNAARARRACADPYALSRRVYDLVLKLLRPVEAATRRLIVVLASKLPAAKAPAAPAVAIEYSSAPFPKNDDAPGHQAPAGSPDTTVAAPNPARTPLFGLADTPRRYDWLYQPKPEGALPWAGPGTCRASPYDQLDALPLLRRVAALARALEDLPAQARRLQRWWTARLKARAAGKFVTISPLRLGRPPGSLPARAPKRARHEEHDLLSELDREARSLRLPDTS